MPSTPQALCVRAPAATASSINTMAICFIGSGISRPRRRPRWPGLFLTTSATLLPQPVPVPCAAVPSPAYGSFRSEEHTSELQSLMTISYAVFCLIQNIHPINHHSIHIYNLHVVYHT